jgi:hypothetical protein
MRLDTDAWSVEKEGEGQISITRDDDIIHVNRDDDDMTGERWYFDYEPADGSPVSEQFRVKDQTELSETIEMFIEKHG